MRERPTTNDQRRIMVLTAGLVFLCLLAGCGWGKPLKVQGIKVVTGPYALELSVISMVSRIGSEAEALELEIGDWRPAEGIEEEEWGIESMPAEAEGDSITVEAAGDTLAAAEEEQSPLAARGFSPQEMEKIRELMMMPDDDKTWVRGVVSEEKRELLMPGLPVVVRPGKKSEQSYLGYLASIFEVSGRYQVEVVIKGGEAGLRRGQMVNACITYRRLARAMVLSTEGLLVEGGGNSVTVYVLRGERAEKMNGLAGYLAGRGRMVAAGDFAAEEVVLLAPGELSDGRRVVVEIPEEEGVVKHWSDR